MFAHAMFIQLPIPTSLAIGMNFNFQTLFSEFNPQFYLGGDNAAFWHPLAMTIIFGLSFATILTLIVVPSMYAIIYARKERKQKA